MPITFTVNGTRRQVDAPPDTPLLYVLRNDLEIGSPQFGCGLSQCGACSVLVDGKEVRACTMAVRSVSDKQVTTIGGLPRGGPAKRACLPPTRTRPSILCSRRGSTNRCLCADSVSTA